MTVVGKLLISGGFVLVRPVQCSVFLAHYLDWSFRVSVGLKSGGGGRGDAQSLK